MYKLIVILMIILLIAGCASISRVHPRRMDLREFSINDTQVDRDRIQPYREDDYPFDKRLYTDENIEISCWTDGRRFLFYLENKTKSDIKFTWNDWEYLDPKDMSLKVIGNDVQSKSKQNPETITVLSEQKRTFWFAPVVFKMDEKTKQKVAIVYTKGLFLEEDYGKDILIKAVFTINGVIRNLRFKYWIGEETSTQEKKDDF
ncbi:MAG: hypothetical protein JXA60_09175 [Candidatus Coatesbacteria bacterium]|nr:hypothetical protein [Candidatus Coatesbacteria bacterium]